MADDERTGEAGLVPSVEALWATLGEARNWVSRADLADPQSPESRSVREASSYLSTWLARDDVAEDVFRNLPVLTFPISPVNVAVDGSHRINAIRAVAEMMAAESQAASQARIGELVDTTARREIMGLTVGEFLLVVLVILLAVGVPIAQVDLQQRAQALMSAEESTVGLAFAITTAIVQRRKK
jgi:hypothetical protein